MFKSRRLAAFLFVFSFLPKWVRITLIIIVALLAFILFGGLGPVATALAPSLAKSFGNVDITVERLTIVPITGHVRIVNLAVLNASTYVNKDEETPPILTVGDLDVSVKPMSLFSKKIIVNRIHLSGVRFNYTSSYGEASNLEAFQAMLAANKSLEKEKPDPTTDDATKGPLDFLIHELSLEDNGATAATTWTLHRRVPLLLPPMTMTEVSPETLKEAMLSHLDKLQTLLRIKF